MPDNHPSNVVISTFYAIPMHVPSVCTTNGWREPVLRKICTKTYCCKRMQESEGSEKYFRMSVSMMVWTLHTYHTCRRSSLGISVFSMSSIFLRLMQLISWKRCPNSISTLCVPCVMEFHVLNTRNRPFFSAVHMPIGPGKWPILRKYRFRINTCLTHKHTQIQNKNNVWMRIKLCCFVHKWIK